MERKAKAQEAMLRRLVSDLQALPAKGRELELKEARLVEEHNIAVQESGPNENPKARRKIEALRASLQQVRKQQEDLVGDKLPEIRRAIDAVTAALADRRRELAKLKGDEAARRGALAPPNAASDAKPAGGEGGQAPRQNQFVKSVAFIQAQGIGTGSGVVITSAGHVVTNSHVIATRGGGVAERISVAFDSSLCARSLDYVVIDHDTDLDLALLAPLDAVPAQLVPLAFQTSPMQGTEILALGFPMADAVGDAIDNSQTCMVMTKGMISGVRSGENGLPRFLQIDVRVSGGNSGGPLVDTQTGHVVGLVTFGIQGAGDTQAFAIPGNIVVGRFDKAIAAGK